MEMITWEYPGWAQAYLRVPSGCPVQWVPIGLTWLFIVQFQNFQVFIVSRNEIGFFSYQVVTLDLPLAELGHALGTQNTYGYLGNI